MRRITEEDRIRVVKLLEAMRDCEPPLAVDVEAAVGRRLRALGIPRAWSPPLTLKEFGLGAAASILAMALAAAGILSVTSPQWLTSPSTALQGLSRLLATLGDALWDVVAAAGRALLDLAGRVSDKAVYLDSSLTFAAQSALLVFGAMLALTVIVVFHESRSRRLAG